MKIMKKTASAILAAVMALSMSAGVYAIDYVKPNHDPLPKGNHFDPTATPEYSEGKVLPGSTPETAVEIITEKIAEKAIENGTPIYGSSDKLRVKSNVMLKLARTNLGKLRVVTKRYSVEIDSSSVTEAKDIDLGMTITKNAANKAIFVKTNAKGSYGCTLKVRIAPKYFNQGNVDIRTAHLYCIDSATKRTVDMGPVELDSSCNIVITMTRGGKYVIM